GRRGGRGRGVVIPGGKETSLVVQVFILTGDVMEQVGIVCVPPGDGGGASCQDDPADIVVGVKGPPVTMISAGRGIGVGGQHHLAICVGEDDVLITVGQRLDGFGRPAVEACGVVAGGVSVGEGAEAAGAVGGAGACDHRLGDAALAVVLVVGVGIGS